VSRKGYFRRIDPTPYRVRLDLFGPVTTVNQGEVIFADIDTFKDVIGFTFVGWTNPSETISTDPARPTKVQGFDNIVVVGAVKQENKAPHKVFLEQMRQKIEEEKQITNPTNVIAKEQEDVIKDVVVDEKIDTTTLDNTALIAFLKKFDRKKWFVLKKHDAISYMDRLKIDYSNLPNDRKEYVKFLKDYITNLK
jgi:hypothetical protein